MRKTLKIDLSSVRDHVEAPQFAAAEVFGEFIASTKLEIGGKKDATF